ncbi:unconventional myosin-Ia [Planococcus citri]|uniref:unconventional myosin-Ia n=1 Tax=Planococcus citri TaxID=170843 RepID=UPI0031F72F91
MEKILPNVRKDNCVWDFVLLNPLTEESFLKNLYCRYKQSQIYTYIGNELVSVNPYKNLDIYSREIALTYLYKAPFQLPPHIFSIIATAYRWLNDSNEDQCIMMSGESGSGKSEALRKMLHFLSYVILSCDVTITQMKNNIINANNLLEAFGHASTCFNKNSSRFGKYLDIEFDHKGEAVSASFTSYLLDKDRITNQPLGERNFHIFYQLLVGADVSLLKSLKLQRNVLSYSILKQGGSAFTSEDDRQNFATVKKAMEEFNFTSETIANILKIISSVLKLGNLVFISVTNIDGTEGCAISNEHEMYDISELLGININAFRSAITCRSICVNQRSSQSSPETTLVKSEMSADEAAYYSDRLCKALYSRLFTWLVKTVNTKMKLEPRCRRRHLSFLDLFGFENFDKNGFYQFIINYCNEKLYQAVFESNIRSEQEEYVREGIEWTPIDYVGTHSVHDTNEKVYDELLSILDCSNDLRYLSNEEELAQRLDKIKILVDSSSEAGNSKVSQLIFANASNCFSLHHYAGNVIYDVAKFTPKSNDVLHRDVSIVMYSGSHPLMKALFPEGSPEMSSLKKLPVPISKQIKIALNGIFRNLNNRRLYYVKCLKPNEIKEPNIFEMNVVLQQIRCQRIIETVRLRRSGFAFRLSHSQFLNRYKMLSLKTWPYCRLPAIQSIQYLLHDLPIPAAEFAFGTTKMFIRSPRSVYELEEFRRQRLNDIAVILQSTWRKFSLRRRFQKLRRSQIIIANAWKKYKKRREFGLIKCKRQIDWAVEIIQRHYIQWKRYQFLTRLIVELSPRTMSPLNQDWPSCNIRLAEASLLLRKLHHKWRCQAYRSQFNQTTRNKMREKVTASFLFRNKKCCYTDSVPKPFLGDYVRLRQNTQWRRLCSGGNDQYVVFADIINKITRSTGKFIPMLLVISTSSMMILDQRTLDIKYRIPASEIHRISLSPFADNIAVVHIHASERDSSTGDLHCFSSSSNLQSNSGCFFVTNNYYEKGDIIFQSNHVIEVSTKLFLVIQNAVGRPPDINISSMFNAYFHQQIVTISFYCIKSAIKVPSEPFKIIRKGNKMEICVFKD